MIPVRLQGRKLNFRTPKCERPPRKAGPTGERSLLEMRVRERRLCGPWRTVREEMGSPRFG